MYMLAEYQNGHYIEIVVEPVQIFPTILRTSIEFRRLRAEITLTRISNLPHIYFNDMKARVALDFIEWSLFKCFERSVRQVLCCIE